VVDPVEAGHPGIVGATEAALKSAVYAYSNDFVGGKPAPAYSVLSARCQAAAGQGEFAQEVKTATHYFKGMPIISYHVDSFDPPHATVSYSVDLKTLKTSDQPWLYQRDGWKFDSC
jgi:hypothetical protein